MTEGEKRQLRKDLRSLEVRIKEVNKNINSKFQEAYTRSREYTNEELINLEESISSLIRRVATLELLVIKPSRTERLLTYIKSILKTKIQIKRG